MTDATGDTPQQEFDHSTACWTQACPLSELVPGTLRTFKKDGAQLVLARTSAGEVHALDNRCPHEGYPLAQGTLSGTALTCCWHNWKFDVRDGTCTLGGEDVRAYPVRVAGEHVEVDLADPPAEESFPKWRASFLRGIERGDVSRSLRDGVRLLAGGYAPWALLADIAAYDARHAEYGSSHALAVAADVGRSLARYPGAEAMRAIGAAVEMCADEVQRLEPRADPRPVAGANAVSLRAAVEAEDLELARGLLAGAFDAGVARAEIEGWMYAVLADHFLGFGHQLIYMVKTQELLAGADGQHAAAIYDGLLVCIVLGTREDTLPYMRAYAKRLAVVESELEGVWARQDADASCDEEALADAVLDGTNEAAFAAVWDAALAGVAAERIARALVVAAAERVLRFDDAHERDPSVAEGWLWATHRFTFAGAVRNAVLRFRSPDALRLLVHAVMFIHSGRRMDLAADARLQTAGESAGIGDVMAAIDVRDPAAAVSRGLGFLAAGGAPDELEAALMDACLNGRFVRPIFEAHGIKMTCAAFEEYAALEGSTGRAIPVAATLRFLASPVVERSLAAAVTTSIGWVVDGKVPAKLTQ